MKQKFFASLLTLFCSIQLMATSIIVERTAGANIVQDIALIGKWVFVDSNLQLIDKEGNVLATEPIASVQKIIFSEELTAVDNVEKGTILIYPNPTQDMLYIQGIEAQTLRVYDLYGHALQTTHGTEVSVSNLPVGTYLLQIGTQVVRFIKQ